MLDLIRRLIAAGLLITVSAHALAGAIDLILINGKIFTATDENTYVQGLAIRGDRIVAVGGSDYIKALAQAGTRQIDLHGRTVIPGINDAHLHLHVHPADQFILALEGMNPTWADLDTAVHLANKSAPVNSLLVGDMGFGLFGNPLLNRESLDQLSPHRALILTTLSGHASVMNSAALSRFGLSDATADPVAGKLERGPGGRLDGFLREYAEMRPDRMLADQTDDNAAVVQLNEKLLQAAKLGITSIQDMANAIPPERCVKLLERTSVPMRIRIMRMPLTTPNGRDIAEGQSTPHHPTALINVNGVKWILDGTPMEGTFAPRVVADNVRLDMDATTAQLPLTFPIQEIRQILQEALKRDEPLLLHVSGYPAARAVLDSMQSLGGAATWSKKRVRFEHGDGLFPDLVPALKALGIVVVQNPAHFDAIQMAPALFPKGPASRAQPLLSLIKAGIPVALGSDGLLNPFVNILFATMNPDRPAEAISREEAVIAYTRTAAYAEFAEKEKGTLELGKLADLTVLSQDLFTVPSSELPKTESVFTLMGGTPIYDAGVMN